MVVRGDGATLTKIAKTGQTVPEGNGWFNSFSGLQGSENGQIGIVASVAGVATVNNEIKGIYLSDGDAITKIAREFDPIPGTSSYLSTIRNIRLNNSGNVAFSSDFDGFGGGAGNALGLFRGDGDELRRIAMFGDPIPGSTDQFELFETPTINELGNVAFMASAVNAQSQRSLGIFTYDDVRGVTAIVREGDELFGSSAIRLRMANSQSAFNDSGQIAFYFELSDGRRGVAMTVVPEPTAGIIGFVLLIGIVIADKDHLKVPREFEHA